MDLKTLSGLAIIVLIALTAAMFTAGGKMPGQKLLLPWEITTDTAGNTQVLGLTLNHSTLADAEELFQSESKVSLFNTPNESHTVEAYFKSLTISGIRAALVLTLNIDQATALQMFDRGQRMDNLGNGRRKITLSSNDLQFAKGSTISLITYIPGTNLDEELINDRFGQPTHRLQEASGIIHFLYPEKGLDIALNQDGKEVLQYIAPANFDLILQPLLQAKTIEHLSPNVLN